MESEVIVCSRCHKTCKAMVDRNPVWFGRYENEKQLEVICIDCWKKGERWEKEAAKK